MVGISGRAGPSGAYYSGHTDPEPASGRARDSSSEASSSNSPQVPPSSNAPASPIPAGRQRLLRSRPLSSQTREWLEQGMPTGEGTGARNRPQASADAAAPHAGTAARRTTQAPADAAAPHAGTAARRTTQAPADAAAPRAGTAARRTTQAPADVGVPREGAVARANRIVQQLVSAGADLAHTRRMFRNAINGHGVAFSAAEQRILLEHFPDMLATGISQNSELATELRDALRSAVRQQAAQAAPAVTPTPPRAHPAASSAGSSQRSLFGRFARLMTPNQGRSSNTATSQASVDRRPARVNQVQTPPDRTEMRNRGDNTANAALQAFAEQGGDLGRLRAAIQSHVMQRRPIPEDIGRRLQSVGIPPAIDSNESILNHPLLNLSVALNRRLGASPVVERAPRPAVPTTTDRRAMSAAEMNRRTALNISSQFSQLRTISKAESEELGFKDAADHGLEDATHCLFGGELSLGNRGQQVIGLASIPYGQEGDKELVFMDMKKLAQYLAGDPRHPMHRQPLNAGNIASYAFRIVP
ncbi:Effector protein HopAB2 [Pseudomonas coronafaciens pv. porri]|nr:Effector protein HopAB2 [Pseudomonas coronafaciens pv. porri]RMW02756.1 Effector protein HopAB2 [Pseudomonas coronafaciens pv. porri]